MKTEHNDWQPIPDLPRRPTDDEREQVASALPRTRLGQKPELLWVQRLESASVERGLGESVELLATAHSDYDDLKDVADEIGWRLLQSLPESEGYRDRAPVSMRMNQAMDEAQAWLDEWRGERDVGVVRVQPRRELVAIVQRGPQRIALGLTSGRVLGQWRFDPQRKYHRTLREMSWKQRIGMALLGSMSGISGLLLTQVLFDGLGAAGVLALTLALGVVWLFLRAAKRDRDTIGRN